MTELNVKEMNYRFFKNTNDGTKEKTPNTLVGHIDSVNYEKGTLILNVNGSKSEVMIADFVKGVKSGAGCVSNPSALEDWKGFEVVERKIGFAEKKGLLWVNVSGLEYCFGYVAGKRKVNKQLKKPSSVWVVFELDTLNEYLKANNVAELTNEEYEKVTRVVRGF